MELKVTGSRHHGMDAMMNNTEYYDTFEEFLEAWYFSGERFHELNHCIGYDIVNPYGEDYKDITDKYNLILHMMQQRKAIYVPVIIKDIKEKDMPEIESFLNECWEFMRKQWKEISFELPSLEEQAKVVVEQAEAIEETKEVEQDHKGKTMKLLCNCGNEMEFKADNSEDEEDEYGHYRLADRKKFQTWAAHDQAGMECTECGLAIWYFA